MALLRPHQNPFSVTLQAVRKTSSFRTHSVIRTPCSSENTFSAASGSLHKTACTGEQLVQVSRRSISTPTIEEHITHR